MPVHVSIHDVSPAWEREIDVALEMTQAAGVRPALLVVPNFHGAAPLDEDRRYVERLHALADDGHEIYLHGYYHRAGMPDVAPPRRGLVERLRHGFAQKVVSASEAELSDVSRDEATMRLVNGERMLRDVGLPIHGFVAPAWSMPRWVVPWLGAQGYRFTEDHLRIYDPVTGKSRTSVVLNYASRTPGRLLSSVAWCRVARPGRRFFPARIAIHPADVRYALLRQEIESLLRWAEGDFVATGRDLMS
jgi:predicted deacetylase